ncbi:MAG: hypothetical protein M0Q87_09170 [Ottowia sp.]|nr:hypothetical protein [Ottowia sp.]
MLQFLLLCFLLLTGICFKLGWRTVPPDWRARGGFVLGALLAAATLGVMGVEHGASRRLQAAGIEPRSLSDFGPIYCAGGTSGPFLPAFSLHSWAMRLKIKQNCPRFPTRLASPLFENATIAKARQTPRFSSWMRSSVLRWACQARRDNAADYCLQGGATQHGASSAVRSSA